MAVRVILPRPLRSHAGGVSQLDVESDTVAQVLQVLEETYPGLSPHLRSEDGTLLPKVNLYVNDEHVRYLQGVQTVLQDGDQVYIVPLVMGG